METITPEMRDNARKLASLSEQKKNRPGDFPSTREEQIKRIKVAAGGGTAKLKRIDMEREIAVALPHLFRVNYAPK